MRTICLFLFCFFAYNGQAQTTVFDVIANSEEHTSLESAILAAGLADTLASGGPFTVFAPTDAAFAELPPEVLAGILADPEGALTASLLYHGLSGKVLSTDLTDGMIATMLNGDEIMISIIEENIFVNNAKVTMADIEADNGVVHIIDAVLTPPIPTVVDVIVNSPIHETLETAVGAAGLVETLQGDGPFTVFAPTDAAFAALPDGALDGLLADPSGALTDVLLYHVLNGTVLSTDLMDGMMAETINGKDITVRISNDSVFINDALVTIADIEADNGVVHVIDAVLLPPRITVVDVIVNSEDHTTLETAVGAAGLVETLQGDGPFTVFAPTDAAFAALPDGALDGLLADPTGALTDVLLYHVLNGTVLSTDLMDGMTAMTLNGKDITVRISNDSVFINDALVTMADIETDNGVVHVIDAVLLPPRITVVDVIVNSEDHTTLETAVGAAGLVETLQGDGPFTVFAPTDAAFAALPDGALDGLLADPTGALTDVLLYHVLNGTVLSTDLMDGMTAMTLNGKDITVRISNDSVFINDALVTMADIETDNGVVHVIDAVLLPPTTVWDIIVESENHTTLETAVLAAGLNGALNSSTEVTVFAPTDAAFAAVDPDLIAGLLNDPQGNLTTVLLYHVVAGRILSTDLSDGQTAMTLQGEDITVTISNDSVFINDALVTTADIEAENGVVHVIDAVLLPSGITNTRSVQYQLIDVKVFPNPTSESFIIDWKGSFTSEASVRMINSSGKLIKNWISTFSNQEFNVQDLPSGMYFLDITIDNKKAIKQIVVE